MLRRLLLTLVLVMAAFAAGYALRRDAADSPGAAAPAAPPSSLAGPTAPVQVAGRAPLSGSLPDFTTIAANSVKAVTNISSVERRRVQVDPFFRYFFGDDPDLFGSRPQTSLGSGVVVSPDGYVLTNAHVVGDTRADVTVALWDKREIHAKIVGIDRDTDIALLKIDASSLPTMRWGNSADLKIAEWVLAIGNPYQLSQTVTLGIVSAIGRTNLGIADYEDFIQTDAAINPGNSGGALVSSRGELIGINTGIFSQSGGYQGIGFAVPSNLARRVMTDLINFGTVRRGAIGIVGILAVTTRMARELGVPITQGAYIAQMYRDSEAYQAGLEPGDVIVSFNGQPIEDPGPINRLIADSKIGSTVRIGIIRDGRKMEFQVPVGSSARRSRRSL
ncbi:MAG: trypsin-like peptidase domain-containing protein [Acidobacteria bacterium]|nr:trypsin-like peptidase domain-containing protein [Acidobacteriota bacterium]